MRADRRSNDERRGTKREPRAGIRFDEPRKQFDWWNLLFWAGAIIVSFILLLPLYVLVKISVSTVAQATAPHPSYLIENLTWANWHRMLDWARIGGPLQTA